MKPAVPVAALCFLSVVVLAPSASAATATWSDDDACELTVSIVTLTFCTVSGGMQLQSGTGSTPCTMSGSTYVSCEPYLICYAYFGSDVPFHYAASCTGFSSESCDGTRQAGTTTCPGSSQPWASYLGAVAAGSCATYTLAVDLTPQVPLIPPAHLSHSITLCVSSTGGPSLS